MNSNIMGSLAELANLKQLDKEKLTSTTRNTTFLELRSLFSTIVRDRKKQVSKVPRPKLH